MKRNRHLSPSPSTTRWGTFLRWALPWRGSFHDTVVSWRNPPLTSACSRRGRIVKKSPLHGRMCVRAGAGTRLDENAALNILPTESAFAKKFWGNRETASHREGTPGEKWPLLPRSIRHGRQAISGSMNPHVFRLWEVRKSLLTNERNTEMVQYQEKSSKRALSKYIARRIHPEPAANPV